jgi:branched-subunit amino acid transport protein
MTTWVVVLGSAVCTYVLRAWAIVALDGRRLPDAVVAKLRLVAPAVLAAVTAGALAPHSGGHAASVGSVVAVVAAFAVVHRTRRPMHALMVGLPIALAFAAMAS